MRKVSYILVGAVAGAALMFGIQAGAADLLTGSKVAGTKEVTYNGESIGQAAIINNSSYLPVRALADAIGAQIDLSGGKINLSEPNTSTGSEASTSPSTTPTQTNPSSMAADEIQAKVSEIDSQISNLENMISINQEMLARMPDDWASRNFTEKVTTDYQSQITQLQQQKADLEAQLQALQNQ